MSQSGTPPTTSSTLWQILNPSISLRRSDRFSRGSTGAVEIAVYGKPWRGERKVSPARALSSGQACVLEPPLEGAKGA